MPRAAAAINGTAFAWTRPAVRWWELAVCEGAPLEVFYPEHGRLIEARMRQAASDYCDVCPVRIECLSAALHEEDGAPPGRRHGLRGGLTPAERAQLAAG